MADSERSGGRSIAGAIPGAVIGAAVGRRVGVRAEKLDGRRLAQKLNQESSLKKVVRGARGAPGKAGLGVAKAIRGAGIGLGVGGAIAAAPTYITGGIFPLFAPTSIALGSLAGFPAMLGGVGLHDVGDKMKKKLLAKQIARRATFARRGRGIGLAAGAALGAAVLGRRKKPLEKRSSVMTPFMQGFAAELIKVAGIPSKKLVKPKKRSSLFGGQVGSTDPNRVTPAWPRGSKFSLGNRDKRKAPKQVKLKTNDKPEKKSKKTVPMDLPRMNPPKKATTRSERRIQVPGMEPKRR